MMKHWKLMFCILSIPTLLLAEQTPNSFTFNNDGLNFSIDNENYQGTLHGWIFYDGNYFQNNQNNLTNGAHLQQAFTAATFTMYKNWQITASGNWSQQYILQNLNLSYLGSSYYNWTIGQFSPDFGLDNDAAQPYTSMMNLALPANAFSPNYGVGVQLQVNNQHWSWANSITGPRIAVDYQGHDPLALVSRLLYVPVHTSTNVLHFGLSFWQQYPSGSNSLGASTTPEVVPNSNATLISTGNINNLKSSSSGDFEFAYVHQAYNLNAEYFLNSNQGNAGQPNLSFNGYDIETGYFLTGESRQYSYPGGFFNGISTPKHAYGAWQVTTQFSHLNLNSNNVRGGDESNLSAGLNWYLGKNFIFRSEVIRIWAHLPQTEQFYTNNVYAMRLILQV